MKKSAFIARTLVFFFLFIYPAALKAQDELTASGFSGKSAVYVDDYNGFKLKIPVEFKQDRKGASTAWIGPHIDSSATGIYMNVTEMRDVASQVMYDINLQSKKKDRAFTDVVPLKIKMGSKMVPGFWCREALKKPGSPAEKPGDESHTWFLFAFGNKRCYQCNISARYSAFKANKVQKLYEEVLKSIELVPAKEG